MTMTRAPGFWFRTPPTATARLLAPLGAAYARAYNEHRYHAPKDEYDPEWDWSGVVQDLQLDYLVGRMLAETREWPNWNKGDDVLLRAVANELHSEDITVVRPEELAPDLRSPSGILGRHKPDADIKADIRFGWKTAKALGALDIGQCVVVRNGVVIAVEGIEGTDATLVRGGELGGPNCTAVKVLKPGQDERLDLPSIGAGTIALLAQYRYACLAFEAGKTLFFDQQAALKTAHDHNIAIVGIPPEADTFFENF